MSNLTTIEREWLRHIVFVYPWVSRSLVWSLRSLIEHPAQAALYAEIGHTQEQELPKILEHLPYYMKAAGYFPSGWTPDGKPQLVNPGSVNTWSTLTSMMGLATGQEVPESLLGPGAEIALHEVTGRDAYGRAYSSRVAGPITDSLVGLPQVRAFQRAGQTTAPDEPLDLTNDRALIARERADAKRPIFVPAGFYASFAPLLAGGLWPRVLDPRAVEARFWRDAPAEERLAHEKTLLLKLQRLQGKLIGRPVPPDVQRAAMLAADVTGRYQDFASKIGRDPTTRERAQLAIRFLSERGRIDVGTGERGRLLHTLEGLPAERLDGFLSSVLRQYADGAALAAWHEDVRVVASFNGPMLSYLEGNLRTLKLEQPSPAGDVPQPALRELGRRYLAYSEQVAKLQKLARDARGAQRGERQAELRAFVESHDEPVRIPSKSGASAWTFPSLARIDLARMSDTQRHALATSKALGNWSKLGTLDKAVLGVHVDPQVSEAWTVLDRWMAQARAKVPLGKSLPSGTRDYYAKLIGRKVPGYLADYKLATAPLADRLARLSVVRDSPNRDAWTTLLAAASQRYRTMHAAGWSDSAIARFWQASDAPRVREWVHQHPDFARELRDYPGIIDRLGGH